ncbi:alanine racemase [Plastoroseomonas arctica]|uniref:Alanine racemase n=1 Tax=Plastoroseomonas arctica TaxID=1509237 RepID=A0AAF1KTQ0_9PROT|nr:alanine racemase [Plastoroseomonas arctica]MBR0655197.1 alanine racemase [Plastoroseomonas arctica]
MATDPRGRLIVDLGAIVANWRDLCALHAPGKVAGVVKADGYGLGAGPVAQALRAAGCDSFFVAHLQEGMALRDALGPGPMIAVLNGFRPGDDEDAHLTPVLNTLGDVRDHRGRRAILHLDTGMARLGLDAREQAALAEDASLRASLDLAYVMTHLACADEPAHALNDTQRARFTQAAAMCPGVPRSLANSSGLFLGAGFVSDLARPGCALYGVNPTPGAPNPMRQVLRLEIPVLQIRDIGAGETIGYSATWRSSRPSRIATIAAGYADGYLRSLSGRASADHGGRPVPLVGRVSMDLITLDVTDRPEITDASHITLIGGSGCTPDDLASACGTIGYEILTSLGARYVRVYTPA